jgi:hypothetical protein
MVNSSQMHNIDYDISGPGIIRAVQEGVRSRKYTVFVYDYDSFGRILRIGYALAEDRNKKIKPEEIKWLAPDEYQIIPKRKTRKDRRAAELGVEYAVPPEKDKGERQFLMELTLGKLTDIRLRTVFRLRSKAVQSFVVQAELRKGEKEDVYWVPIVRYDCAHGFIHRDLMHRNGGKTKIRLSSQKLDDAIKLAMNEMERNLSLRLVELGFESRVPEILENVDISGELQEARDFLLLLVAHPDRITQTPSKFVEIKDKIDHTERIWPP